MKLFTPGLAWVLLLAAAAPAGAAPRLLEPSRTAAQLDAQLRWTEARLIAVQDAGRYKTLDSFARESMSAMHGREHLPGLTPMASLMEWLFNREAYAGEPVVRIKDKGLRIHFSSHLPPAEREYIVQHGYMTLRQLADPVVQDRMRELEPQFAMVAAMRRVRDAQGVAGFLSEMLFIVPPAVADPDEPWRLPDDLVANLPPELRQQAGASTGAAVRGVSTDQAVAILGAWARLGSAWRIGDAAVAQESLDRLASTLPTLAPAGVYPAREQRSAEALYYATGKFAYGWLLYFLSALVGAFALITRWKTPWIMALALLGVAMLYHAFGLGLRWYILGRIPVANMFEAVISSAWIGIALALLAELIYRTRVFVFAAAMTGFFALILGQFVIPGGGTLTTIMGILDDVMLRIHTVLIIASYAMIFLAAVIAVVYLFGYYFHTAPGNSLTMGVATALAGGIIWVSADLIFTPGADPAQPWVKAPLVTPVFWVAAAIALALLIPMIAYKAAGASIYVVALLGTTLVAVAIGDRGFILGGGLAVLATGLLWAAGTGLGLLLRLLTANTGAEGAAFAGAGGPLLRVSELRMNRPILAGGAPGDEAQSATLPHWLHTMDWSHLIMLNLVFVLLFVGTILGAVWADYSWGRPWGWDPKEVFALNTWIVYAILIHARFLVRNKGLWTAWLSVAGCGMMAFNWCFVNFYIVGLHSYA